jgi:hypothetical protein
MHYENQCLKFTARTIRSVETARGLTDKTVSDGIKKTTTKSTNNRIIWQQKLKKKRYIYIYIQAVIRQGNNSA